VRVYITKECLSLIDQHHRSVATQAPDVASKNTLTATVRVNSTILWRCNRAS